MHINGCLKQRAQINRNFFDISSAKQNLTQVIAFLVLQFKAPVFSAERVAVLFCLSIALLRPEQQ